MIEESRKKHGVLLVNLGTPKGPSDEDVKPYLRQFLMDPWVVDIPYPARWLMVNGVILRTRPQASAELYKKIWTERGSPLLFHTQDLASGVRDQLGPEFQVEIAMRYGEPGIESALVKLKGTSKITAFPLYPQYSLAATESSIDEVQKISKKLEMDHTIQFIGSFHNHPLFISAFAEVARPVIEQSRPDHVIMSFHGIPERHVLKTQVEPGWCLKQNCCDEMSERNARCYRAQCYDSARLIAQALDLRREQYSVAFQSRLGRSKWIEPYTDLLYPELAKKGLRRLTVLSPSFVADCLETLEEIAIRGKESFIHAGGEDLTLVPSLNSHPAWVKAIAAILLENS